LSDREEAKVAAAAQALDLVRPGMVIGIGTGSTARYFIEGLGRLVQDGLDVTTVPTSRASARLATSLRIPTIEDLAVSIDLAVDGADEVDPQLGLIKGRGGALTREKLVAAAARKFVVIVDESKLVRQLGRAAVPVEVLPFLWRHTARRIQIAGAMCELRGEPTRPYRTDNGNVIIDLYFPEPISDPLALGSRLKQTVGVVEHGLFLGMAHACLVAGDSGHRVLGSLNWSD
jgi:ribose 5-phosphate isomerase A